jgi:TolB-like protein/Flp pilus assembly protein TadD
LETPFAAYQGDEPCIFVCYAHEDSDVVYPEMAWLREQGLNLWYDEGISAGKNWRAAIGDSLLGASHVLFYISPRSLESDHCNREINLALDEGKDVVPIYLEDVELTSDLKVGLNRVQALHRDQDASYRQHLLSALGQAVEAKPPSPSQNPKLRWRRSIQIGIAAAILLGMGWWYWEESRPSPPVDVEQATSTPAIAVLPFVNMSNDPEQEYFSDGITEDILNELARNTSLTVRARSSTFALKGASVDLQAIGQRLNVTHVLEGSVRRSGTRIRVTVQLSEVEGNRSIWSQRYERELTDIFEVQDEITGEVLVALNAQFLRPTTPRKFAGDEAYEAFLLGRYHFNRAEFPQATRWLNIAKDLDPTNADAWGYLAQMNIFMTLLGWNPNSGEYLRARTEYMNRALAIDPTHANVLGQRAYIVTFIVDRDYQASIDQLVELVRVNPNNPEAHLYLAVVLGGIGRDVLTLRVASRFVELDPLSPNAMLTRATALLSTGAVEEVRQALDALRDETSNAAGNADLAFDVAFAEGDVAAMQATLGQLVASPKYPVYAALVAYLQGNQATVQEILGSLTESTEYVPHWVQSRVALIGGRFDSALDHWREGIRAGEPLAVLLVNGGPQSWRKTFPEFYEHPGYQRMVVDFGLDAESISKITVPELPF